MDVILLAWKRHHQAMFAMHNLDHNQVGDWTSAVLTKERDR